MKVKDIEDTLNAVNEWIKKCIKYPAEYPVNVTLEVTTSLDTLNTIKECLQTLILIKNTGIEDDNNSI